MGRGVGVETGGTLRLIQQVSEWRPHVERELIDLGLRLRDFPSERCDWRDLQVIVDQPTPGGFLFHVQADAIKKQAQGQPVSVTDSQNVASAEEILRNFT